MNEYNAITVFLKSTIPNYDKIKKAMDQSVVIVWSIYFKIFPSAFRLGLMCTTGNYALFQFL